MISSAAWADEVPAATEAPVATEAAPGPVKEHHNHFFAGLTGVGLGVFNDDESKAGFGGGAFFEFTLIENVLELEVSLTVLVVDGVLELPIDVLLKKPFHANAWIHPFIGVGPTLVPVPGKKTYFGLAFVGGSYFWFSQHIGLVAELNYNLLYYKGNPTHEAGGRLGLVFGW